MRRERNANEKKAVQKQENITEAEAEQADFGRGDCGNINRSVSDVVFCETRAADMVFIRGRAGGHALGDLPQRVRRGRYQACGGFDCAGEWNKGCEDLPGGAAVIAGLQIRKEDVK